MLLDNGEPSNYEEVMAGPDSKKWLEAMKSKIGSMYENEVWTLTDLPVERRAIENKWIFKKKTDADGNVTVGVKTGGSRVRALLMEVKPYVLLD